MKDSRYFLVSLLILVLQILIWAEFNLSPYIVLALLPLVILCLPVRISEISALLLTFCIGFASDFLSNGVLGLCTTSLLPVCFLKNTVIRTVFGSAIFARKDNISIGRAGVVKFTVALLLVNSIFLLIYIFIDAAGTRSFLFLAERFITSLITSTLAGLAVARLLDSSQKIWS